MSIDLSKLITAEDKLEKAKASKVAQLSAACEGFIKQGFLCSALGEPHLYPLNEKDQLNLASSSAESILAQGEVGWTTPFWCSLEGTWEMREHTAEQIQQVGREAKAFVLENMMLNDQLAHQVSRAATIQEVESIEFIPTE